MIGVTLPVWETSTGRCLRSIQLSEPVSRVGWTPAGGLSLLAAAAGARLLLLNPGAGVGAGRVARRTDELLEEPPPARDTQGQPISVARSIGRAPLNTYFKPNITYCSG